METKTCATCKQEFPINNFYKCGLTSSGKIRYANECKDCRKRREKERYDDKQLELMQSKCSCVHCGLDKKYLLEFHHRDPSKKEFSIAHWRKHSKEKLLAEIKECDTLCKNCHAEFHYLNKKYGITYENYLKDY